MPFKSYSERSKAKRALVQVYKSEHNPDLILTKVDGKWGFHLDDAGTPVSPEMSAALAEPAPVVEEPVRLNAESSERLHTAQNMPEAEVVAGAVEFLDSIGVEVQHDPEPAPMTYIWPGSKPAGDAPPVDLPEPEPEHPAAPAPDAFSAFAFGQLTAPSNNGSTPQAPEAPTPVQRTSTTKGQKIEKDRPLQNGVQMPSAGTACRQVWDALSAMMVHDESTGLSSVPTAQDIKALGIKNGWNLNNVSIEYYRWRKFNGITGRGKKSI
jgi:hypothetical protein